MATMMDLDKERIGRRQRAAKPGEENPTFIERLFGKKKREQPKMGSDKNVDAGSGRGTTTYPKATPAPKMPSAAPKRPSMTSKPAGEPVAPPSPASSQTAGIAGLAGGPSGSAAEREPVAESGPAQGKLSQFEKADEIVNQETPRMLKGLFGEDIPEDVYKEMERKNKEAGFYGRFKKGGSVKKNTKKYASGGSVSSASKRGDGCATKGKTRGRMV